jgi:hypothetical protein
MHPLTSPAAAAVKTNPESDPPVTEFQRRGVTAARGEGSTRGWRSLDGLEFLTQFPDRFAETRKSLRQCLRGRILGCPRYLAELVARGDGVAAEAELRL